MDEGESGDPMDQLHRNEAISAVADEGFLGEEDDDHEDLYNDVNVGEGFLQSLRKNNNDDNLGFRNDDVQDKKPQSAPGVGGGGGGGSDKVDGLQMKGGSGSGIRVELGQPSVKLSEVEEQSGIDNSVGVQQPIDVVVGSVGNEGLLKLGGGGGGNLNRVDGNGVGNSVSAVNTAGGGGGGGCTVLVVRDLHWWTTDAEVEVELCKYGPVKKVKFVDEKANGKSKGYCQVEFYDPNAATTCKEVMNGHVFNGRPCVVAYASPPFTVKKMAQGNRNQSAVSQQGRRGPADVGAKPGGGNVAIGGNYQGGGGYGRGNWGRGKNPGMGNRGPVNPMSGRGIMGNGGNGFGQGIGAAPPLLHHQSMMNQGFDPGFGGPMGRMGGYGGFPGAPTPPFSGILPSFPGVGGVGLPGVGAPHVNPNPPFFGRGMHMNGMGSGWGNEESSYGEEEAASDHQYGEASHDRTGWWPNATREKDRGVSERDWSGSSGRDKGYERDAPREKDMGHDLEWLERRHHELFLELLANNIASLKINNF